jgi:hypothetical protein
MTGLPDAPWPEEALSGPAIPESMGCNIGLNQSAMTVMRTVAGVLSPKFGTSKENPAVPTGSVPLFPQAPTMGEFWEETGMNDKRGGTARTRLRANLPEKAGLAPASLANSYSNWKSRPGRSRHTTMTCRTDAYSAVIDCAVGSTMGRRENDSGMWAVSVTAEARECICAKALGRHTGEATSQTSASHPNNPRLRRMHVSGPSLRGKRPSPQSYRQGGLKL